MIKKKSCHGKLKSFDKEKVNIQIETEEKSIERNLIAQIKVKYNW